MNMSETERAKEIDDAVRAADAKKRADAEEAAMAGEKLDKILTHLDALSQSHGRIRRAAEGQGRRRRDGG